MMFLYKRIIPVILFFTFSLLLFSDDTITFSGNNMKTILARGKERTLLSGMAELTSKDNFISADSIELYGKDYNYIFCTGNVHVINKEKNIEVWSKKLFYDRKADMIRFQDNALMEDKENEIVVKGGLIETWEEDEITIIQIGVRILKKDMVCRSEFARYLRKEDRLELSGMPRVIWKGDEYKALKIYIDLENDEINLEGNVKGEVFWEEEEEKTDDVKKEETDTGKADVKKEEETDTTDSDKTGKEDAKSRESEEKPGDT
ncbi:MAG: hypothetical protein JXB88_04210 [Spirochaetales bacterium]|nr:hypothetical protein [Spirochaetales bacterium]